jgi:anti-sigma-K factor RskA
MARELSRDELEELLGAYALDAVDADERDQIDQYLDRDPSARSLVAEYHEIAALLAQPTTKAPPGLWDHIARTFEAQAPELQMPSSPAGIQRGRRRLLNIRRVAAIAAAAATIALVLLTTRVVQQNHQIDDIITETRVAGVRSAAQAASRDPNATHVRLLSRDGSRQARIVYLPDGQGYLVGNNLTKLTPDQTYQLWALVGDGDTTRAISAGVLGPEPTVAAFKVRGAVVGFVITQERTPGVVSSTNPALLQGTVS